MKKLSHSQILHFQHRKIYNSINTMDNKEAKIDATVMAADQLAITNEIKQKELVDNNIIPADIEKINSTTSSSMRSKNEDIPEVRSPRTSKLNDSK